MQPRQIVERVERMWGRLPSWLRLALPWVVIATALAPIYLPALLQHIRYSANPLIFNDDVRIIIFPYFHDGDAALFNNDPISHYFTSLDPLGFRTVYFLAAKLWDAAAFSKLLPYLLLALLLVAVAATANKLGGKAAAFGALALALGCDVFLARMGGGLARAFAYPLIACAAAALALGRAWWLAALVVLAAAFYPVIAVIVGLSLAGMLLLLRRDDAGDAASWSLKRRLVFLTATALAAAVVLAPMALALRPFGAQITPAMVLQYPEAGPGGRLGGEDRPPFPSFVDAAPGYIRKAVFGGGKPVVESARKWLDSAPDRSRREALFELVVVVIGFGWARLASQRAEARRVLLLLAAAITGHLISLPLNPRFFLPQRYVVYTVPLLAIILIAPAFRGLLPFGSDRPRAKRLIPVAVLGCNIALVALVGSRGSSNAGLDITVRPREKALYDAIARLPKDALVAGWPPEMDNVPYVARRKILLSQETMMPFHTGFTLMMRERMRALIAAYFATTPEPLLRLRDKFGVTHLVVNLGYLRRPPRYFRPFESDIGAAFSRARGRRFEVEQQLANASVYRDGSIVILDLSKLRQAR